jgi:hypothetical protein
MSHTIPNPQAPPPKQVIFDVTPEIFATDGGGAFGLPLTVGEVPRVRTAPYDELRLLVSAWHPSSRRTIDLDRAYLELRARIDPHEDHWMKLAEIEPIVPAYADGESFDGFVVLPVMAEECSFALFGSGFEARARIQVRAYAYLVT